MSSEKTSKAKFKTTKCRKITFVAIISYRVNFLNSKIGSDHLSKNPISTVKPAILYMQ